MECGEGASTVLVYSDELGNIVADAEYPTLSSIETLGLPGYGKVFKLNYFYASGSATELIYVDKAARKLVQVPGGSFGSSADETIEIDVSRNPVKVTTYDWVPGEGGYEYTAVFKKERFVGEPKKSVPCR